jgi:hypothetical protein
VNTLAGVRAAALVALVLASGRAAAAPPALPRLVDLGAAPTGGRVVTLGPGGNLQAALDGAQPGDIVTLAAGATYTGPFTLPRKMGDGWITVRSSALDSLPPAGRRVSPEQASLMPKIRGQGSGPAVATAPGAHHFRFVGIEFHPDPGHYTDTLITLGTGQEETVDALPHHLMFERCFVHGDATVGGKRGIGLNGGTTVIADSWLSDWKGRGQDTQALAGWNGTGPFKIVNNHVEGAGENLIFGGADARIRDLVPSDIEIRRNHFTKPLAWNPNDREHYGGARWSVKNLLELKNARRVLVDGNLFENNWLESQSGYAILFTPRNQDGAAPWSVVEDVTFSNNVVRRSASGIQLLGRDNNHPSQQLRRLLVRNNLFEELGGPGSTPDGAVRGTVVQFEDNTADIVFEHNTALQSGNIIAAGGRPHTGLVFRDNLALNNEYGVIGTDTGPGRPTLARYFPDAVFDHNVIVGGQSATYPSGNAFPSSVDRVGFVNRKGGDCRLAASSAYRGTAADGRDPGVDLAALLEALGSDLAAARVRGVGS